MKRIIILLLALSVLAVSTTPSFARSGCCSHHGGVSGCGCADGTPLSSTCLPYYPECQVQTQNIQNPTSTPIPTSVITHAPLIVKPQVTKKPKKIIKPKKVLHKLNKKTKTTPTPTPKK